MQKWSPESSSMAAQHFVGTWRLVSQATHYADGTTVYPRGEDALGILMYDPYGNMAVQLMRAGGTSARLGSIDTAMNEFLAYFGTYSVGADTVTHHLKGCSYAHWLGTAQVRYYKFDEQGERLTLSVDTDQERYVLIWQRM